MDDHARVAQLLGREPRCAFDVVVRDDSGDPVVVRNAPLLDDGTPMPTRYYLVGEHLVREVSRLEAGGGVREAEAAIDADAIAATHARYAAERDAAIEVGHTGPRPSGGVGGTRTGVKCLHAHVAYALAGGDDPVGRWALDRIEQTERAGAATAADPGNDAATEHADASATVLTVDVGDDQLSFTLAGETRTLPVGPLTLCAGPLADGGDPPSAASLTNALGLVHDHLDDLLVATPWWAAARPVVARGEHADALARVELGVDHVPAGYVLTRADADEVFRTLALEPAADRRHNPGLPAAHVESIVATCCVILGLMRRFELTEVHVASGSDGR